MTKILVLYYSAYGHMETMAKAAAEGVESAGAQATLKRVPELVPDDVARSSGMKIDQDAPVARPEELVDYDGLIVGVSTRYSMMAAQLKNFFDQTGSLWMSGALIGKAASVMSSTATQHGGQEIALVTTQILLQHQGYVIVPLSYAFKEQMGVDVVKGGSPYGATTMADGDGSRMPSDVELDAARFQGKFTAEIAAKLAA